MVWHSAYGTVGAAVTGTPPSIKLTVQEGQQRTERHGYVMSRGMSGGHKRQKAHTPPLWGHRMTVYGKFHGIPAIGLHYVSLEGTATVSGDYRPSTVKQCISPEWLPREDPAITLKCHLGESLRPRSVKSRRAPPANGMALSLIKKKTISRFTWVKNPRITTDTKIWNNQGRKYIGLLRIKITWIIQVQKLPRLSGVRRPELFRDF